MKEQNKATKKIGIIGLGLVGTALAETLLENDYEIVGFDIDPTRCDFLSRQGAVIANGPRQTASEVDVLILSLPDSTVVDKIINAGDGVLKSESIPKYCIDTTTGDPEDTEKIADQCSKHDMFFLDATISGSSKQIAQRQGVFMVGGDRAAFDDCLSLLNILSEKVFYLGQSGNGSRAKLASNLILGLNRLALAEGLVFAEKLGLDTDSFLQLLKQTPAYSTAMDVKGEKMIHADFKPDSRIRQHHKDVALILKYAEKIGQQLPLSSAHMDILDQAIAAGEGDLDNAAVINELKRRGKS